jgi:PKD domain-containing protein
MHSLRVRARPRTLAPILVAFVLLTAALATSALAARGIVPTLPGTSLRPSASHAVPLLAAPPVSIRPANACTRPATEFSALWGGAWPSPAVAPNLQGACAWGTDQNALGFLSNWTNGGARASFTLALPPAGTAIGQTMAGLEFGVWAAGVPCSYDQASQIEVQLIPPASPYSANFSAAWSVRAPAYDLAPPSSCDPTCSNDTALFTLDGASFCEDQIVRSVAGGPPTSPVGSFSPGDTLALTVVGAAGSGSPLTVYVNDTTHPGQDLSFSYGAADLITGQPLSPLFANANASQSVWGLTPGISATALLCPWTGVATASCLSYNETTEASTPPLTITAADFWNSTTLSYTNAYDAVATASSTGACSSGPIACTGFTSPSAGFYPSWSLHNAGAGGPTWEFGGGSAGSLRSFAGALAASALDGAQYATVPSAGNLTGGTVDLNVLANATVADPAGIAEATVTLDYCDDITGEAGAQSVVVPGSPSTTDAEISASFSNFAGYRSMDPFWVVVRSELGTVSAPVFGWLNQTTSGPTKDCAFPAPSVPTFGPTNVTAVSGGYSIRWNESNPAAVGYRINATAPDGNSTWFYVGDQAWANVSLAAFDTSYELSVEAENALGNWSDPSTTVTAPLTLAPVAIELQALPPTGAWLGAAKLNLSGTVTGGLAPYSVTLRSGDGNATSNETATGNFTLLHDLGSYQGSAVITVVATDALGDVAVAGPFVMTVYATPLGALQLASAGENLVNISFSVPPSVAAPLTGFTIVYTTNASLAWELEAGYASNTSIPGIIVWNTSAAFAEINAVDGLAVYAQVLARNAYGVGWLPAGGGRLITTPSALALSPIVAIPGGRAPFTDNVSASVTGGTNDTIVRAIYSYPPDVILTPTITDVNGTTYLNATLSFPSPGTYIVVLHATDIFFGTVIGTTPIYISPGVPPAVSAELVSEPAYVDSPLQFQAAAAGGSGDFAWNWSFGDGNFSNLADPLHSYAISGGYNVVLTITDLGTGGFNVTTLPIVVYAMPVLFVSVTPGPNGSLSYDFHAAVGGGSGPSTVVWTFGDGGLARGAAVSHDYRSAGTYEVNVSATDPAGRSGSSQFNLSAFASGTGGSSSATGLTSLDVTLIILAAGFGILALLLAIRRPVAPPPSAGESEDGEVSLT